MDAPLLHGAQMTGHPNDKIGAGKALLNRNERSYKRGTLMFIEGESSTEMFIIKAGLVRILKQEGENTVELAQLGPGSVLGELSLLDHQPRGATAQVVEDTTVTIIDEELFTKTLSTIPSWLATMIQLVVKRLRDTMKKTGDDIVKKSIAGVIQVMLLLHTARIAAKKPDAPLLVATVKEQVHAVIGLGKLELENVFMHLILKNFLRIKKNQSGREYVDLHEVDALRLYMQYLRMHQRGGTLNGESLSDKAVALAKLLVPAATQYGAAISPKVYKLSEQQLQIALEKSGGGRFIDRDALDELIAAKLIKVQDEAADLKFGHSNRSMLMFNSDLITSVVLLKQWLPLFCEEIKF